MNNIRLEFSSLNPDQAQALCELYKSFNGANEIKGDNTGTGATMGIAQPQPQAAQAQQPAPAQPQPQAAAPAAQAAPQPQPAPAPATASGQVSEGAPDAFGVPYNPKLHSSTTGPTGGQNNDGSWKMKKGADRAAYQKWSADHRQAAARTAPAATGGSVENGMPAGGSAPAMGGMGGSHAQAPANMGTMGGGGNGGGGAPGAMGGSGGAPAMGGMGGMGGGGAAPQPGQPFLAEVSYDEFVAKCNELATKNLMTPENVAAVKQAIGCQDETQINNDPAVRKRAFHQLCLLEQGQPLQAMAA